MAQYNGYVSIPHASYDEWRSATLGSGYNADYAYGNQCWDYCAELWHQYGLTLYTKPGGGGAADCWLISRNANAVGPFEAVWGVTNIKRGDILVFDRYAQSSTGHIAFADEDYNGSGTIRTLAQVPTLYGITGTVHSVNWSLAHFLGIFRNKEWQTTPGPTPSEEKKEHFPWPIAWEHWGWD